MSKEINAFYTSEAYLPNSQSTGQPSARMRKAGRRPVLLVIPEMSGPKPSPCSYIRLLATLLSPAIQKQFEVRFSSLKQATHIFADIVLVNRVPCEQEADLYPFFAHVKEIGATLIYEIDDNLLKLHDNHPEVKTYKNREAVVSALVVQADRVWTSTEHLSEALRPLNSHVATFENYLDLEQLATINVAPLASGAGAKFRILYMGTMTHAMDLDIVLNAMRKLHSEGIDFELSLIGITASAPSEKWIKVIHPPESASSYPQFMQWLRSLPRFDLGIAPLESVLFNSCKSPIKYWDYTSIGIPTLASDVVTYNGIIEDGETGFLANNSTEEWYEKIKFIIQNQRQLGEVLNNATRALSDLARKINGIELRKAALLNSLNNHPQE